MNQDRTFGRRRFLYTSGVLGGTLLTGSGILGGLVSPASAATWTTWEGSRPPDAQGFRWGVPELWWYGKAQVFSHNAEIEYRADDATSFWVRGRGNSGAPGLFGVVFRWGTPLPTDDAYRLTLRMADPERLPELITVNGNVVWTRSEGYTNPEKYEVQFTYIPAVDNEIADIYLINRVDPGADWSTIYPPHQGTWVDNNLVLHRSAEATNRPDYDMFDVPRATKFAGVEPHLACRYLLDPFGAPVDYSRPPLPRLEYPAADVTFLERAFGPVGLGQYERYIDVARPTTLTFQPGNSQWRSTRDFEQWAAIAAAGGVRDLALTPLIEERKFSNPDAPEGVYIARHMTAFINRPATPEAKAKMVRQAALDMAGLANRWIELVPDGHVHVLNIEMNSVFGNWRSGISESPAAALPGYEAIAAGGSKAWELTFAMLREFRRDFESGLSFDPERVTFAGNPDKAGFAAAYSYHSGVDVVFSKNIHRQSVNVVTANSRGAAAAYSNDYGYDFDNWDRNYAFSYHPDGIAHALKVYFHAGARYLMDEIRITPWDANAGSLSAWGRAWLDFQRYARSHPRLGSQQVSIAWMRGLGDEWSRIGGPSAGWEAAPWLPTAEMNAALEQDDVPAKWAKASKAVRDGRQPDVSDMYLRDYNLLDLVFAEFGHAGRTKADRLTTGTPYGPADLIPWDAPPEHLSTYDVIGYLGRGAGTDSATAKNLSRYVADGGTLVIAAGQLRSEDGTYAEPTFLGVRLGERGTVDGLPYTRLRSLPDRAEVVATLPNGDPQVVRIEFGRGVGYLLSGEWLTYWDEDAVRTTLRPALERAAWLDFTPTSDRLEYMVQKKGQSFVFPIFNHGRGHYPSNNGVDHGPWSGSITVDLRRLGLARHTVRVCRGVVDPVGNAPAELVDLPARTSGHTVRIDITVNELEEVVVGPQHKIHDDYFG